MLHGDVHAGNVLLRPDGTVTLIDFGLAQVSGATGLDGGTGAAGGRRRGARPRLRRERCCTERTCLHSTLASEQYAIATLAYRVLTSTPYLDLAASADGGAAPHRVGRAPALRRGRRRPVAVR